MAIERTGLGDPARTVALLWNDAPAPDRPPRGPRARLDIPGITAAAVLLADEKGLRALTMRGLASRLGLASPNALYTYVPSKAEVIDLMVDRCFASFELEAPVGDAVLGERLRAVADANLALYVAHPWLADVAIDRPPLGPGQMRKYELELQTLDGCGLTDHRLDLALGLIVTFVRAHATTAMAAADAEDEQAWWASAGPALAQRVSAEDFPLASRVGQAVGEAQGRATDPDLAYRFGIESIAAGILGDIEHVLPEKGPYDALGEREQAVVRATWDESVAAGIDDLNLEAEFTAAGESWSEADAEGRVVRRNSAG